MSCSSRPHIRWRFSIYIVQAVYPLGTMDAPQSLPLRSGRAVEDSHRLPSSSQDATRVVQLAQAAAPSPTVCSPVSRQRHGNHQHPLPGVSHIATRSFLRPG